MVLSYIGDKFRRLDDYIHENEQRQEKIGRWTARTILGGGLLGLLLLLRDCNGCKPTIVPAEEPREKTYSSLKMSKLESIGCSDEFDFRGERGEYHQEIDLGTGIGNVDFSFDAYTVPDRFILEYDKEVFDTGFVSSGLLDIPIGHDSFNKELKKIGMGPINENLSGTATVTFKKSRSHPTTAKVVVISPLEGTVFKYSVSCPK